MKINNFNRTNVYQAYQKYGEQTKAQDTKKKAQYEQVELSNEAKLQIENEKQAKIERLKNEIANGTYRIDSEKIAEKLLTSWESGVKINE